jgi:hypothetical protein
MRVSRAGSLAPDREIGARGSAASSTRRLRSNAPKDFDDTVKLLSRSREASSRSRDGFIALYARGEPIAAIVTLTKQTSSSDSDRNSCAGV